MRFRLAFPGLVKSQVSRTEKSSTSAKKRFATSVSGSGNSIRSRSVFQPAVKQLEPQNLTIDSYESLPMSSRVKSAQQYDSRKQVGKSSKKGWHASAEDHDLFELSFKQHLFAFYNSGESKALLGGEAYQGVPQFFLREIESRLGSGVGIQNKVP